MRESFSMVQNILFVCYIKVLPAHQWENILERLWETMQFVFLWWILEGTRGVLTVSIHFCQEDIGQDSFLHRPTAAFRDSQFPSEVSCSQYKPVYY